MVIVHEEEMHMVDNDMFASEFEHSTELKQSQEKNMEGFFQSVSGMDPSRKSNIVSGLESMKDYEALIDQIRLYEIVTEVHPQPIVT
jgi:hypothetical protein